ncbi:hypothetical protein H6G97_46995 [Nostoc flagelliforme FACHB-838]|uniref:Uncharacterized protein n=1 Tax=Nostoc flagelliforme FACHB-838 TaxID=2692904 RepID=A0ABR8E763_9NOSO|nr:hypothetical protein [Nostoc flagelliforme]MBD2536429.1 hypothetical protein [Nostoc flagelliforme FACHB-838]
MSYLFMPSLFTIHHSFGESIREGDKQSKFLEDTSSDRHVPQNFFAIGLMANS